MRDELHGVGVRPPALLSDGQKRELYDAALHILGHIGMRVHQDRVVSILVDAGATLEDGSLVRIPPHLVAQARATVPSTIPMYDREGRPAMLLGGLNSYFGTGSDLLYHYDLETGERRPVVLADVATSAKLCDALPNIDFVMTYASASDVPPSRRYLEGFRAMTMNTVKPIVVTAEGEDDLRAMWRVACQIRGGEDGLRRKPYFVAYVQPVSPLSHSGESMDKLLFCCDAGIPMTYNAAPLAGATAPVTSAGHAAQSLAEALFGMVVMQLRRPGAPYLLGTGSGVIDLVTGQCCYDPPENLTVYLSLVEMARWLDIPNWGYAGTSDSALPDLQAGIEAGKQTLLSMLFGSNLNHDIAYLDKGITGALEMIVVLDECIASDRRLLGGLVLTAETLALDVIEEVGPGGEFLTRKHTRRNMRTAQWRPSIFNRLGYQQWEDAGSLDLRELARRKAKGLLGTHRPEPVGPQVAQAIDAIVAGFQPS